ncbi:MAG: Copper binding periplasmic protein CusF [Candidatus Gallionella acididurans]|uniref:Copper binding periplasmic protein CusF n=1 Tax=Candidatus Gallionella acididurans TaxID=1796491 RepID=A0A139BVI9_9PROT|nr:MAG: Copper binding periplasmic protein CusF [Candidatus Gallionella acididurans]
MKTHTFVSITAVAALSGIVLMFSAQHADASPRNPIMLADAGMNMGGMDMQGINKQAASVTHHGTGTVKKIAAGMVTLAHGPIASLQWPAMTMSFKLKDAALAKGIKAGDVVDFELVQSGKDYMVTRLQTSGK